MIASSPPPAPRPLGFRELYALGFLAYAGVYVILLIASGSSRPLAAVAGGSLTVLPQALLGLLVVRICQRRPVTAHRRLAFASLHVILALAYAVASTLLSSVLYTIHRGSRDGDWAFAWPRVQFLPWQLFEAVTIYAVLASVTYTVTALARLKEEERNAARAAELRTRAELRALQAQLNPHFLFNTLHTLLALVRHAPEAAEEALEQFGDLLHYVLRAGREEQVVVPLAEEWQFVGTYLALEKLRLGDRLKTDLHASPEALACAVPPLLLQPLVENAIRHGLAPRAAGGRLAVDAAVAAGRLRIEVRDDGLGAEPARVEGAPGLGLRLARGRLDALPGAHGEMAIDTAPGRGFRVRLSLPVLAR